MVSLVPWLDGLVACAVIDDPLYGQWEGYHDQGPDEVFFAAPLHKVVELEKVADYYEFQYDESPSIIQEIPNTIGTHAVPSGGSLHSITLKEVVSCRLSSDGSMDAMLIDESKDLNTPVLPGDDCLYAADRIDNFRYFLQHVIASKLKLQDPMPSRPPQCWTKASEGTEIFWGGHYWPNQSPLFGCPLSVLRGTDR